MHVPWIFLSSRSNSHVIIGSPFFGLLEAGPFRSLDKYSSPVCSLSSRCERARLQYGDHFTGLDMYDALEDMQKHSLRLVARANYKANISQEVDSKTPYLCHDKDA